MDEDAAELQALRRRAYGPDADIHADPSALARLEQLEERARRAREETLIAPTKPAEAPPMGSDAGTAATGAAPAGAETAATEAAAETEPGRPRRRSIIVGAVVVVAALIIAGQVLDRTDPTGSEAAAPTPTAEPVVLQAASGRTLLEIPLDRSLSRYVPQPAPPRFPIEGALRWSQSLGSYYGLTLWLGRAAHTDQRCILLEGAEKTFSRCEREDEFLSGLLDVTVPFIDIAPEERPLAMAPGQGMVFRWAPDQGVQIALDAIAVNYFGSSGSSY